MKKITLLVLALLAFQFNDAQDTCATAQSIGPGLYTVIAVNGTEVPDPICAANGSGAMAGEWYVYTASTDAVVDITTAVGTTSAFADTRLHVYSGSCGSLTCIAGNDDIDTAGMDYRSATSFNATNGSTYYIAFDDRWSAGAFQFELTETAVSCLSPVVTFDDFTTTTVDISTDIVGNFEVEWGTFPYTQGGGGNTATITSGDSYQISGLTPGVSYGVFVRQDCGAGDFSNYAEIVVGTSPDFSTLPFTEDLEADANQALLLNFGLSFFEPTGSWNYNVDDTTDGDTTNDFANSGVAILFSNSTFTDAAADATFYIGPFDLTTANEYTFMFNQRNFQLSSATRPAKDIEIIVATTNDGTTNTVLATLDGLNNVTYEQRMATFIPPSDGSYYFGVRDKTALLMGVAEANSVFIDDLSITSQLSTEDFNSNEFSHFYNKVSNTLNLESSNLEMTNVEIYSILGQNVLSKALSGTTGSINLSSLNDGIYLAKVFANGSSETIKFLKN
ncbi:T9SS type A sorting domain-containing protein [Winogradskyella sp.]|uniref:T9SS type A sorting domain-containing protein n=1 Tax=Winogradskyella sp. TaxID=1883156 RepID=UPI00262D14BF|nr:T9SS type A sorting domain-containing protein [Winogradskyella sp.]